MRTSTTSGTRVASYVTFGLGLAAIGVGTALGVMASGDAQKLRTDKTLTFDKAQQLANSANSNGLIANVLWGVGGAAVVGGVVMFLFSMPEPGMKSSGGRR